MKEHNYARYFKRGCRCDDCRESAVAYQRWLRDDARYDDHATVEEVRLWAAGLGFQLSKSMSGRHANTLIERYNREHPERTYQRPSERAS